MFNVHEFMKNYPTANFWWLFKLRYLILYFTQWNCVQWYLLYFTQVWYLLPGGCLGIINPLLKGNLEYWYTLAVPHVPKINGKSF